jgi:hypothetical protein
MYWGIAGADNQEILNVGKYFYDSKVWEGGTARKRSTNPASFCRRGQF